MTTKLKEIKNKISVVNFISYRDYLAAIYRYLKNTESKFSYAAYSEMLGLSKSNVAWLIITGRRSLSPTNTKNIVQGLGLIKSDKLYFEALVKYENERSPIKRERLFEKIIDLKKKETSGLSRKHLEYFSKWYYPVIRELTALEGFESNPEWISKRLHNKLMPKQALDALRLLESLDLIEFDNNKKRHFPKGGQITPSEDVEIISSIRFHQKMCEIGKESITEVKQGRRDINTLTLSIGAEAYEKIKSTIFEACKKTMEIESSSSNKTDVYQLNIQLFPFTKSGE